MPKRAHNCVTIWIRPEFAKGERQNFFSEEESEYLEIDGDTEFSGFSVPFANTTKCPDVYVSADELHYPTIVVESGFSESYRNLLRDKDVWLMGAAPHVNVVLLLSWSKVKKGMKATLEVFRKGGEHESFALFPVPDPGNSNLPEYISLTRAEIFGDQLDENRDGSDKIELRLSSLRGTALKALRRQNLHPAT